MIKFDRSIPLGTAIAGIVMLGIAAVSADNKIKAHDRYIAKLEQRVDELMDIIQANKLDTVRIETELSAIRQSLVRIENKITNSKISRLDRNDM